VLVLALQYYSYSGKPSKGAEQNGQHFDTRASEIGLRFVLITTWTSYVSNISFQMFNERYAFNIFGSVRRVCNLLPVKMWL
jgi:hypothetical protein